MTEYEKQSLIISIISLIVAVTAAVYTAINSYVMNRRRLGVVLEIHEASKPRVIPDKYRLIVVNRGHVPIQIIEAKLTNPDPKQGNDTMPSNTLTPNERPLPVTLSQHDQISFEVGMYDPEESKPILSVYDSEGNMYLVNETRVYGMWHRRLLRVGKKTLHLPNRHIYK